MNKFLLSLSAVLLLAFSLQQASAQTPIDNSNNKPVNAVQQAIMIVPFINKGQDYRTVYDGSKITQLAIDKLKEGFGTRQYHVVDFVTAYDNAQTDGLLTSLKSQDDIISTIARLSGADILIKVDVLPLRQGDLGHIATVRLIASDAATGVDYATVPCESPQNSTPDTTGLILRAISEVAHPAPVTNFFNMLQATFTDIIENGRQLKVVINFDKNSTKKFDSMIEGEPLSDVVNKWMQDSSYKNYYDPLSVTDIQMIITVKVPVKGANKRNYNPYDFMSAFSKFLRSKKLVVGQPALNAGAIRVNIN
jgi:Family of unknown function (DUF6175)